MKILFDCTFLRNKYTGVDIYFLSLIKGLLQKDTDNKYVIITDHRYNVAELKKSLEPYSNFKVIRIPCIYPIHILVSAFLMPLYMLIGRFDVYHNPYFFGPLFKLSKTKVVITVHDLYYKTVPDKMSNMHGRLLNMFADNAIKRADNVIVISTQTKLDVIKYYHLPEARLSLIYQAVDSMFDAPFKDGFSEQITDLGVRYHEYILCVSSLLQHKGIDDLIKAYKLFLNQPNNKKFKLVLVGKSDANYLMELKQLANSLNLSNNEVVFLGYVEKSDLFNLYKYAQLYVLPSHYEGFGLTLLEAMKFNCPVIARNASSLPEVVGDAGLLFNDEQQLVQYMDKLINDDTLRTRIQQLIPAQLNKFTNETRAGQTLAIYLA